MIGALKVSPVIATIATLGIVQGIAILIRPEPGGYIAPGLRSAVSQGFGFIPAAFLVIALVAVALEVWLFRSRAGLAVRGVGFDAEASRRIGRRVGVVRSVGLIVCASGAVVAGIFLGSQIGVGTNAVGATYSLPCFAAVFLGGAALSGGRGSFIGALLGAVFLSLLANVAPLLNIPVATGQMLYGAILIIAVTAYALTQRRSHHGGT
jgi:ribose transport system ATP-binding protein